MIVTSQTVCQSYDMSFNRFYEFYDSSVKPSRAKTKFNAAHKDLNISFLVKTLKFKGCQDLVVHFCTLRFKGTLPTLYDTLVVTKYDEMLSISFNFRYLFIFEEKVLKSGLIQLHWFSIWMS